MNFRLPIRITSVVYLFLIIFSAVSYTQNDTVKIATYNLLKFSSSDSLRCSNFRTVVHTISPDILMVQELENQGGHSLFLNKVMNFYQANLYSAVPFNDGPDSDNGLYYRTAKFTVLGANYLSTPLRNIAEYILRHNVTGEEFRVYSLHLKAGQADSLARLSEATVLRNRLNSLPVGTKFVVGGDYNIYRSTEPAFQKLVGSEANNNGRCYDPQNAIGNWTANYSFRYIHTQSTRVRQFSGGAGGGLDDRFDILIHSAAFIPDMISSSYTPYGNDGNHFNDSINKLPNSSVSDSIANALHYASDHLPVFAKYIFRSTSQYSRLSDVIVTPTFVYPENIVYESYQENSNLTYSNSLAVFGITVRDGGASGDPDSYPTVLTGISFNAVNSNYIRRAALYDGTTELGEVVISGSTITFNGLNVSVSDNNNKNLTLRVSFTANVVDNGQFSFTVTAVNASETNSQFTLPDGGGAVSSTTGDRNRIEVSAAKLIYTTQPQTGKLTGENIGPVSISARDVFNNIDLDYTNLVTISSVIFSLSSTDPEGLSKIASSGNVSWLNLSSSTEGTGTISASASGVSSAVSDTITIINSNVTSIAAGSWSDNATWNTGSPPTSQQQVVINHDIIITSVSNAAAVIINNGGSLETRAMLTTPVFTINNGGTYIHNVSGSSANGSSNDFPGTTRIFGSSSIVEIRKWANLGSAPVSLPPGISWGNLTINVDTLGGSWNQVSNLTTINGNLKIKRTGGGSREFRLSANSSYIITIEGSLFIEGGILNLNNGTTIPNLSLLFKIGGNFIQSGGTFTSTSTISYPLIIFTGELSSSVTFSVSAGTFNSTNINLEIVSGKTVQLLTNHTVGSGRTFTVNGAIDCGNYIVSGSGTFTLNSGSTIGIGSANGISSSGSLGNIQTSTRFFSQEANYIYKGSSVQITGSGLPTAVNDLTINNNSGVTLNSNLFVNGLLTLFNGALNTGTNKVIVTSTGSVTRLNGHISGYLQKYISSDATSVQFEIGTGTIYSPVEIGFQNITMDGNLTAIAKTGDHPNVSTAGFFPDKTLSRYYTLVNEGIELDTFDVTFNFVPEDVSLGTDPYNFVVKKYDSSVWSLLNIGTRTATSTKALGITSFSDFAIGETPLPPLAPNNLQIDTILNNQLSLNWTDNANDELGYRVYRANSIPPQLISGNLPPNTTTFTDTGLSPNTQYKYRVLAYNEVGEGNYAELQTYTQANVPDIKDKFTYGLTSFFMAIDQNLNPSNTEYLLIVTDDTTDIYYVQPDGTLGITPVWQTYTAWNGSVGTQVNNLNPTTKYYVSLKARNEQNITTEKSEYENIVTSQFSISRDVNQGWNLLSIPTMRSDFRKIAIFPFAASNAFSYSTGYIQKDTLKKGSGYWLKFSSPLTIEVNGTSLNNDTISVSSGWNLIGSISNPITISSIIQNPTGIISSNYWSYSSGYFMADTIIPMKGYWVKASGTGSIILSSTNKLNKEFVSYKDLLQKLNKLTFKDSKGNTQTLYFGSDVSTLEGYFEMPPVPPGNIFDVRFHSSRVIAELNPNISQKILLKEFSSPLTIEWGIIDNCEYEIFDEINKNISSKIKNNGEIIINSKELSILNLQFSSQPREIEGNIPNVYSLEQNHPNPFNPTTSISYNIPDKSYVKITVANLVGEEIEVLINKVQEAGRYSISWTPKVPSGIYFYKLEAFPVDRPDKIFKRVRKMIFLK